MDYQPSKDRARVVCVRCHQRKVYKNHVISKTIPVAIQGLILFRFDAMSKMTVMDAVATVANLKQLVGL